MCVDYRQLNTKTQKDAFPLPPIEESLVALAGAQWFSTLDLASGYNQVAVAEKDKAKTEFCILFEFKRMPFGLCNAPGTFQRLMERIFGGQSFYSVLLYLDDVIIFSSSVEQHLQAGVYKSWLVETFCCCHLLLGLWLPCYGGNGGGDGCFNL